MIAPRPSSLAEVAQRSQTERQFSYELADFLHEFERAGNVRMLEAEPELLDGRMPEGAVFDAYLAAVAVALAHRMGERAPAWTGQPCRFLHQPWFASPGRHMRALLLMESPAAFRERNLFVTANAMSVA